MGAFGAAAGAGAGLGVLQGVTSILGAGAQQDAVENSAAIQAKQLSDQRVNEQENRKAQALALRGRLRVIAADAGTGFGGSEAQLEAANQYAANRDAKIIDQNYQNSLAAINAGVQNAAAANNPLLAGLGGGITGLSTGLSLGAAYNSFATPVPSTQQPGWYARNP